MSAPLEGDCDVEGEHRVCLRERVRMSAPLESDCDIFLSTFPFLLLLSVRISAPLEGDCDFWSSTYAMVRAAARPNECAAGRRLRLDGLGVERDDVRRSE